MKKYSKLIAVLLAIAVVICPMISVVASADGAPSGTYKLEQVDGDTVRLTINSTGGFLVYKAVINCTTPLSNFTVVDYTLKSGNKEPGYTDPAISHSTSGNNTTILVSSTDAGTLAMYTQVVITMDVTTGANVTLTNIQAADEGDVDTDATLLTFPGVEDAADGEIDPDSPAYEEAAVVENVHAHVATTTVPAAAATCSAAGTQGYVYCATCGKYFTDNTFATETTIAAREIAIDPTAHSYGEYNSDGNATCTADGTKTRVCVYNSAHKDTVPDTGSMLGHSYTTKASNEKATDANCADPATYYVQCDRCDEINYGKTVAVGVANGHSFTTKASSTVKTPATCTAAAVYYVQCDNCTTVSDTVTVNVGEPNGHSFNTKASDQKVTDATCTAAATYKVQCDNCTTVSDTETVSVGAPLEHNYVWDGVEGDGHHTVVCQNGCNDSKLEACNTNGTGGACSVCGYKAAPTIPVDPNLDKLSAAVGVDADAIKVTFRIKTTNFSEYDNVQLCITSGKYDVTTFNEIDPIVVIVDKSEMAVAGSYTTFVYKEFMLYELGLGFSYQLKGYKGGECVATSTLVETTVVDILKDMVITSGAQVTKTVGTDVIKVAEEAKIQFGNTKVGSDLYNAPSLIGSFDMSNATADVPTLNNVKNHVVENESPFVEDIVSTSVAISKVPTISIRIGSKTSPYNDPSKFAMNVAFTDPINGPQNYTVPSDGFVAGGTRYVTGTFDQIPLYASNSTITITLRYEGSKVATITYSLDSYYSTKVVAGVAPLEEALAKLGASARAQFIK